MGRVRWETVVAVAFAVLSLLSFLVRWLWPEAAKDIGLADPAPTAQFLVLAATLVYLRRYVISTEKIAAVTESQLTASIEPVVTFELAPTPESPFVSKPQMMNSSGNHGRCWLTLDLRVNGVRGEMGPAYNGTGEWLVQAHSIVNGVLNLEGQVGGPDRLENLLNDQRQDRASPLKQITLDVTLETERLDRGTSRQSLGPMRFYFAAAHRTWIPDFPWPRPVLDRQR